MKNRNERNFLEMLGAVGNSLNFYRNLQRYMLEHDAFEDVWESETDLRDEILILIDNQDVKGLRDLIDRQKPFEQWPHKKLIKTAKRLRITNYSRLNTCELREALNEKRRNVGRNDNNAKGSE